MSFSQVPHTIMLVRPAAFGYNPETAGSNAFQMQSGNEVMVHENALREFDTVISALEQRNISTLVVEDTIEPKTTDAIFPNNWITTHEDGKIIIYPMMAPSRRNERRSDVIDLLKEKFQVNEVIDLSVSEKMNQFLEGTGSIVFDHPNRLAYACQSDRTHLPLFQRLCAQINYKPISFHAVDEDGIPIYHTNVMMWIGKSLTGICLDSIKSEEEQEKILDQMSNTNHKVIALSYAQLRSFAGNMIEVQSRDGDHYLLLSNSAFDSLLPGQVAEFEKHVKILTLDIATIEASGGGSIRCMVAGIHLPTK